VCQAKQGVWQNVAAVLHLKQQVDAGKPLSQLTSLPQRYGVESSPHTPYTQGF
jgi:hypothetical protein